MVSPQNEGIKLCSPLAKEKICTESPTPGALQQHLFYGEYDPFKYAPIFESDFVQVTKKGEVLNIHNQVTVVTVGVTSTSPNFALPNVMLLARPINALKEMMCNCSVSDDRCPMELTRLFPLSFVNISIHDVYNHRLRLKLANGRAFYLQLYVHPDCENEVFERWMKLVNLLHTTPEDVYGYEAVTPEIECILEQGSLETSVTELSEWQLEPSEMTPGMRDFYEASRASSKSKKSKKSDKSDKSDCSEKTQSKRSKKSGSSKTGGSDADSVPVFDQDQERWPPVEPPKKKKKRRGSIGFNFFNKGDKGSKERATGAKEKAVPPPVRPEGQAPKGRSAKEEKGGRKSKDEAKKKQEDKSKGKEDKGEKEKKRQREKEERQKGKAERQREKEERQRAKEAKQREKAEEKQREREGGKQKGARDDKRGSQKETRQREKEARQREKETRQRAKEARQREKAEKKQREREDRKQKGGKDDKRGKEPEKRQRGKEGKKQQDKKKPSKAPDSKPKGDKEKIDGRKMDEAVRELRPRVEKQLEDNQV